MDGLKDLRNRSLALARTPGASPWKLFARVYWRWWLASGIFLALFALFNFGLGWDAYRSNVSAYFPAVLAVIVSLSTPGRLRARAADGRGSLRTFVAAWGPYLLAILVFGLLLIAFQAGLGWTFQKTVLVAAYLAAGTLAVYLSASHVRAMRVELSVAEDRAQDS